MKYFLYCRKSTEAEDRQVMSIDSQRAELRRAFGGREDIEIVAEFEESKSAKAPGRRLFGEMMTRIEAGEAQGIVAWAPDRLARNSIDGGRVVYQLDRGALRDLKFATYTFENNPQGKFMLSIMFGQSKYYSDALSENVQRGFRAKVERGWRPSVPPFGYVTCPTSRETVADPVYFGLVRQMFDLALRGVSPAGIARTAREEWGLRMPNNRRSKGVPIAVCTVYRMLKNPFYAGKFRWNGVTYDGRHPPVVSWADYQAVRKLIDKPMQVRAPEFAYTGTIRCGACGLMITAEIKTKPSGKRYVYYHCTKRALGPRCPEPYVREELLEAQIVEFLQGLCIPDEIEHLVLERLEAEQADLPDVIAARRASLEKSRAAVSAETVELTQLRLRRLVSDEEFGRERERLAEELAHLERALSALNDQQGDARFELSRSVISFSKQAVELFSRAAPSDRRTILKIVGSNPTLAGKKLSVQAAKPFFQTPESEEICKRRGYGEQVRTHALQFGAQAWVDEFTDWALQNQIEAAKLAAALATIQNTKDRFEGAA